MAEVMSLSTKQYAISHQAKQLGVRSCCHSRSLYRYGRGLVALRSSLRAQVCSHKDASRLRDAQ